MKILIVIHGYPPRYSAGSEVYSQIIAHSLVKIGHDVQIFTRQENNYLEDFNYCTELDHDNNKILKHLVNIPRSKHQNRYEKLELDKIFSRVISEFKPDIVHFGHLNHLSINLPKICAEHFIPSVYTLHDFWLLCPRGQFIMRNSKIPYQLCDGQEDNKCATECYGGNFSGDSEQLEFEKNFYTNWIKHRMLKISETISTIDEFIAPSKYLMHKFENSAYFKDKKITYLDYGFEIDRLNNRKRIKEKEFVFGYIGTHTPQKGINHLINAFKTIDSPSKLRIWGYNKEDTSILSELAADSKNIEWMGGYKNEKIISEVFNIIDAIVVPSIWAENSPLVIHEAQQARIPVITADYGGMAEYVQHGVNGLLFEHRNYKDLALKMQIFIEQPNYAHKLGQRGYLYAKDGNVPSVDFHSEKLEQVFYSLINKKKENYGKYDKKKMDHGGLHLIQTLIIVIINALCVNAFHHIAIQKMIG